MPGTNAQSLKHVITTLCIIVLQISLHYVLCAGQSQAQPLPPIPEAIIIFGDSLSDTGNVFNESQCLVPTPDAYWHGRFSNGPVWPDHLACIVAQSISSNASAQPEPLKVQNYAHGGATACRLGGITGTVPDLSEQVSWYLESLPSATATATTGNLTSSVPNNSVSGAGNVSRLCLPLQPPPPAASVNATADQCGPTGRMFIVFIGHNDLSLLKPEQMSDPRVLQQVVANLTACRVAALDRLMGALSGPSSPPPPQSPTPGFTSATRQADTLSVTQGAPSPPPLRRPKRALLAPPASVSLDRLQSAGGAGAGASSGCSSRDRIVVWTLAPVDLAPLVPEDARGPLRTAIESHNAALDASLQALRRRYPAGPVLQVYDLGGFVRAELAAAAARGDLNITVPCLSHARALAADSTTSVLERATQVSMTATRAEVCPDPDRYVSYDGLHPTSLVHLIAVAEPFAAQHLGWRQRK